MVVPRSNSNKSKGSYLDRDSKGPTQEQIERRSMIKHRLSLDMAGEDDDIDSLAGDDAGDTEFIIQLSETPSTPSRSSRARRLRSASPKDIRTKHSPAPLRRSKSNEGEGIIQGNHSSRSQRTCRLSRKSSTGTPVDCTPKRSSSFGSFSGFFNKEKSEHRNNSAHGRTPTSSSRHTRREGEVDSSMPQIVCLGKSYRQSLSLDDDSDDEIDHSKRNSSRHSRICLPSLPCSIPKRSRSLGSSIINNSLQKKSEGVAAKKTFQSLLKSKREKQKYGVGASPNTSSRSAPRRVKSLGRSRSGDLEVMAMTPLKSPTRSTSWGGPGFSGSPRKRLERRNGIMPGVGTSPSTSSHHRRLQLPCLEKATSETNDTVSMDSNTYQSRLSSAPSKEEILNNAIRRAKERQLQKQKQQKEIESLQDFEKQGPREYPMHQQGVFSHHCRNEKMLEEQKSPSKSQRSSLFTSIQDTTGNLFPKRPSQLHSTVYQSQPNMPLASSIPSQSSHGSDDDSIVSQDTVTEHDADHSLGTSIFQRGLQALEQIYDDLNV